ncbi:hypothetical protein BDF19DRAFT_448946 [Syncephalis fuscata]|nr:hypothetical protein BDF19DRAFT_448946 [Syncephalis fuscata]
MYTYTITFLSFISTIPLHSFLLFEQAYEYLCILLSLTVCLQTQLLLNICLLPF